MKKSLKQTIEIPDGVEAKLGGNVLSMKGAEGENRKKFNFGNLKVTQEDGKIILSHEKATKNEKKKMNTIAAHIRNLIEGVQKKFEYKLKVCFSHFPITVEVKGNGAVVKNFLGEKIPRKVRIPDGAEVEVAGQEIKISSVDRETAGQAAANFEKATRISGRDRRVFQDGIYITNKCGREM